MHRQLQMVEEVVDEGVEEGVEEEEEQVFVDVAGMVVILLVAEMGCHPFRIYTKPKRG